MMINEALDTLKKQFNNRLRFEEKRPGIYQIMIPYYHEDGDMYEIFIEKNPETGFYKISDFAMTVMRLSYEFDIDSDNKESIFKKIISENCLKEDDGLIYIETDEKSLYPSLLQFAQGIGKVSNMRLFKREVIKSLFYEMLQEFVFDKMVRYNPQKNVYPIPDREELEVDYAFQFTKKPFYLFGIKDDAKARLATISCLEFQKADLPFRSIAIHEDFDALSKKDRSRITSAVDKQFINLEDFKNNGIPFIDREAA